MLFLVWWKSRTFSLVYFQTHGEEVRKGSGLQEILHCSNTEKTKNTGSFLSSPKAKQQPVSSVISWRKLVNGGNFSFNILQLNYEQNYSDEFVILKFKMMVKWLVSYHEMIVITISQFVNPFLYKNAIFEKCTKYFMNSTTLWDSSKRPWTMTIL